MKTVLKKRSIWNVWNCAAVLCAFVLMIVAIPSAAAAYLEKPEWAIEKSCGEDNMGGKKILVAYDTKYGSTATVAERIGDVLCEEGFQVDIKLARNVESSELAGYDGVIVGSGIIMEVWYPEALMFIYNNEDVLATKSVAYFIVCITMREDTEERRERATAHYIEPLYNLFSTIVPDAEPGLFGGALDYDKLYFFDWLAMMLFFGPDYNDDWRDFDKVAQWAVEVGETMD